MRGRLHLTRHILFPVAIKTRSRAACEPNLGPILSWVSITTRQHLLKTFHLQLINQHSTLGYTKHNTTAYRQQTPTWLPTLSLPTPNTLKKKSTRSSTAKFGKGGHNREVAERGASCWVHVSGKGGAGM